MPATRETARRATGYHIVFWEKRATVSPFFRLKFFTSAVERWVVWVFIEA
jgi:hypothetical protein